MRLSPAAGTACRSPPRRCAGGSSRAWPRQCAHSVARPAHARGGIDRLRMKGLCEHLVCGFVLAERRVSLLRTNVVSLVFLSHSVHVASLVRLALLFVVHGS